MPRAIQRSCEQGDAFKDGVGEAEEGGDAARGPEDASHTERKHREARPSPAQPSPSRCQMHPGTRMRRSHTRCLQPPLQARFGECGAEAVSTPQRARASVTHPKHEKMEQQHLLPHHGYQSHGRNRPISHYPAPGLHPQGPIRQTHVKGQQLPVLPGNSLLVGGQLPGTTRG